MLNKKIKNWLITSLVTLSTVTSVSTNDTKINIENILNLKLLEKSSHTKKITI